MTPLEAKLAIIQFESELPALLLSEDINSPAALKKINELETKITVCKNAAQILISSTVARKSADVLPHLLQALVKLLDDIQNVKKGDIASALAVNKQLTSFGDHTLDYVLSMSMINAVPQDVISEFIAIVNQAESKLSLLGYNEKQFWTNLIPLKNQRLQNPLLAKVIGDYLEQCINLKNEFMDEMHDSFFNVILVSAFRGTVANDALVVELGCGDFGANALGYLAKLGVRTIGIDPVGLSVPGVELHQRYMENIDEILGPRKANVILMHAMVPYGWSEAEQEDIVKKIHNSLLSGGIFFQVFTSADFTFKEKIVDHYFTRYTLGGFKSLGKFSFSRINADDFKNTYLLTKLLEFNGLYEMLSQSLDMGFVDICVKK